MPFYRFKDDRRSDSKIIEINVDESTSPNRLLYELHCNQADGEVCTRVNNRIVNENFRSLLTVPINTVTFVKDDILLGFLKASMRKELVKNDMEHQLEEAQKKLQLEKVKAELNRLKTEKELEIHKLKAEKDLEIQKVKAEMALEIEKVRVEKELEIEKVKVEMERATVEMVKAS